MKLTAAALCVAALALGAFGWWGCRTTAGRRHVDEMAGMIPMAALLAAGVLLLAGLACAWAARRAA